MDEGEAPRSSIPQQQTLISMNSVGSAGHPVTGSVWLRYLMTAEAKRPWEAVVVGARSPSCASRPPSAQSPCSPSPTTQPCASPPSCDQRQQCAQPQPLPTTLPGVSAGRGTVGRFHTGQIRSNCRVPCG